MFDTVRPVKTFASVKFSHHSKADLRHEQSSPARTLGSWVGIPLEAWISVCVVLCIGRGLTTG
jgi:hypothetical protein